MELLEVILFLLLCAVGLGWVARHFNFPYPIALVIGGGALGFIPSLPEFPFDPQLILVLVLPPVLYQAALITSWRDFRANLRPIGLLAIGLVVVTTLAVGATLKLLIPDLPWAVGFVLGAIISPPDAVAATVILSRLNIPRRVVTILEGESLVNDASGLVLYKFAVAAVLTGSFSLVDAGTQFAVLSLGGILLGVALAFLFIFVHRHLGDPFIEVLMTLSVPYIVYIATESLHLSGVLAVVAAGLVRGRFSPEIVSAETRIMARSMWNVLVFLLNSLIFILIGLQLSHVHERLAGYSLAQLLSWGLLISVVAIAVRFAWIFPAMHLPRLLIPALRRDEAPPVRNELFIMGWCGMRGIVSLAAALALPLTLADGSLFPHRDLIIFITFMAIAVTLVVQGLSLPRLIRALHVGSDWRMASEERHARHALSEAAIATIDKIAADEQVPADLLARLRIEFAERTLATDELMAEQYVLTRRMRLAAIQAERQALISIWRDNQISDDVLHHIEEDLDYRESHL